MAKILKVDYENSGTWFATDEGRELWEEFAKRALFKDADSDPDLMIVSDEEATEFLRRAVETPEYRNPNEPAFAPEPVLIQDADDPDSGFGQCAECEGWFHEDSLAYGDGQTRSPDQGFCEMCAPELFQ